MRIEGGCGDDLRDVLELAPNVQRVYIAVDQKTNARTKSLRQALRYISPREAFVIDMTRLLRTFPPFPWSKDVRADEAMAAVEHAIAKHWAELVCPVVILHDNI